MFKNNEVTKVITIEVVIGVLGIIIMFAINNCMYINYKQELIKNNAYIINNIIENNPNLEDEIISSLTNQNITYYQSTAILKKYGLTDLENIDYINNNSELKNKTMFTSLSYVFFLIVVMFTIFCLFIKRTYKKINDLSKYTNNILNNRYTMDIREYEEGDISNLKNDLYKMTIKLKEQNELSLKDKKYLEDTLSDISHQLKTPLTSMYVINELMYDDNIEKATKRELLLKNRNQLERIEWLVSSLLKMSRLDSGSEVLRRQSTELNKIIEKAVEPLKIPLELKNISFTVACDCKIKAKLDLNWTSEALINIIKNACEHTPEGGKIIVHCTENPIYVGITITDTGCGISSQDKPHIFERFYKGKNNKESIGIGLNMAKKIVDMQSGDIVVKSEEGKGTTFEIKFYKNVI
jgi:signal transduction histidine kinase